MFVDAVLYRYRAGIPWRDLPARFGDFRVVHLRHSCWSQSGVWQRVFEALAQEADKEYAMIDSTIVRALGNPTGFHLTPGQAHDLEGADVLLADTAAQTVIADKGYDAQARVVKPLLVQGKSVVIPSRRTTKVRRDYGTTTNISIRPGI